MVAGAGAVHRVARRRVHRHNFRVAWFVCALGLSAASCNTKRSHPAPPMPSALASSGASGHGAVAPNDEGDGDAARNVGIPHSPEPLPLPPAASATSLKSEMLAQLTTVRVSGHTGSVILRKEGGAWTVAGQDCSVPGRRMQRALDNLVRLKAALTSEPVTEHTRFELEIVALVGQERWIHFSVADRKPAGDLVRLMNEKNYRIRGLDRALWSTDPATWCRDP